MIETGKIKRLIQNDFPDLDFHSIAKIGEGMDSAAYLVNDSLIFRFPKREEVRRNLEKEIYALPILRPQLNVKIPDFKFIANDKYFAGYEKIEGEFLTKELFETFSEAEQNNILESLAQFLTTLHQQDISVLQANGFQVCDFRAKYQTDFDETRKYLFPMISDENREFITAQFELYLENDENFLYEPVFLHNDFSADHILIDPQTKNVTGIIDFGDVGVGDADYDLMYLLDDYGESFVRSFLKFYQHPNYEKLFSKLYFWALVDILRLINLYSSKNESAEIEELQTYLSDWICLMKTKNFRQ